ncbi:MAG: hypothetical protein QOJ58_5792 [Alphaproteobacteria bacterium]|nr:hypothetical protein [Alphaproteobacteria bacterium]
MAASNFATVVLPDPETPMTTAIMGLAVWCGRERTTRAEVDDHVAYAFLVAKIAKWSWK